MAGAVAAGAEAKDAGLERAAELIQARGLGVAKLLARNSDVNDRTNNHRVEIAIERES